MGKWVLPVIFVVVLLGFCGALLFLKRKYNTDKKKWEEKAEEKYRLGKNEASEILRTTIDKISDDKDHLNELSEKELMVEVMLALAGYGRRLDRIEEKQKYLVHYDEFCSKISEQTENLSNSVESFDNQIDKIQTSVSTLEANMHSASKAVYDLADNSQQIGKLLAQTSQQISQLQEKCENFEDLQKRFDTVLNEVNETVAKYTNNPVDTMNRIIWNISAVQDDVHRQFELIKSVRTSMNTVTDGPDSLSQKIGKILNTVKNSEKSISNIEDSTDYIPGIKSLLNDIKSDCSDIFSIKCSVDDIESDVSSIKSDIS